MGEIKSVKVDNWGVFFLQKLQNFFNKTDYCDLTLQFRDNSQLKVHRLVLSACTDYFNVLEQKCEVVDDAIIMPSGLQADVVVPIVNFMYTGTLEFELKMYNRLLKTAKDMNMTVLLKLLEAHRRTMEMHPQKNQLPTSPKLRRKQAPSNTAGTTGSTAGRSLIQPQQQRRIAVGDNAQQHPQQQRNVQSNAYTRVTSSSMAATSLSPVKQQIGSTTFTRIKQEPEQDENAGGGGGGGGVGGYTLLKKPIQIQQLQHIVTSPFEQLRKGYNNNKRPAAATFISPPAKKPNLEDVKEFAEQQRMRKQIAAEFGDDGDYDAGIMDDDTIHNDDDDDDVTAASATPSSTSAGVQTSTTQHLSDDPPGTTTIIVKHEGPDKPPTIVVKDSSNSKMNHAKIISEVLRQYPHLVNSNKNIKLKIMPNAGGQTQKIIVKKEAAEPEKSAHVASAASTVGLRSVLPKFEESKVLPIPSAVSINKPKPQSIQSGNISDKKVVVGSTTAQPAAAAASTPSAAQPQKRRIDSKTMHALIALGAENTTGPWLCLRCGRNGHPISIPSYRGFRRHLINTHKEIIDPSLCEHCGWRSASKRELHFHMQLEHRVKTNLYIFPECQLCQQMCIDSDALNQHLIDSHPDENKQQCIYCNKIFPEELQLYTHMKTFHKKQALEDGIIDYSDDENTNTDLVYPPPLEEHEMQVDHALPQQEQKKIKILSDISLPIASSIIKTETFGSSTEQVLTTGESTTSVASEDYLHEQQHEHVETKFVAADGSEVILTDEQRKEILSQLNQENEGSGVVMVLNENQHYAGGETQSEHGAISHDETSQATTATNDEHEHDEQDDSPIYNELKSQGEQATEEEDIISQAEPETSGDNEQDDEEGVEQVKEEGKGENLHQHAVLDESKESADNLEWAENLISEHDMADEIPETTAVTCAVPQQVNKDEELKDDEGDKSQEDISNKLKELAGDWSENDEDDEEMLEEPSTQKLGQNEELLKKENVATGEEEEEKVDDHEMAESEKDSQSTQHKVETSETVEEITSKSVEDTKKDEENKAPVDQEAEAMVEDDVDLALKSLHKENDDDDDDGDDDDGEADSSKNTKDEDMKTAQTDESLAVSTYVKENEEVVQETTTKDINVDDKDCEKNVDSPQQEVKISPEECEAGTLAADEETKKDLIDMLLSEHAEAVDEPKAGTTEDSNAELAQDSSKVEAVKEIQSETTADIQAAIKSENDDEIVDKISASAATESSTQEPLQEDEFLDISFEKAEENKEDLPTAAVSSAGTEEPHSPSTALAKDSVTSEERVKSLISEWGDDEDEDENEHESEDADLKANL